MSLKAKKIPKKIQEESDNELIEVDHIPAVSNKRTLPMIKRENIKRAKREPESEADRKAKLARAKRRNLNQSLLEEKARNKSNEDTMILLQKQLKSQGDLLLQLYKKLPPSPREVYVREPAPPRPPNSPSIGSGAIKTPIYKEEVLTERQIKISARADAFLESERINKIAENIKIEDLRVKTEQEHLKNMDDWRKAWYHGDESDETIPQQTKEEVYLPVDEFHVKDENQDDDIQAKNLEYQIPTPITPIVKPRERKPWPLPKISFTTPARDGPYEEPSCQPDNEDIHTFLPPLNMHTYLAPVATRGSSSSEIHH